jgi:hypothetical protein
MRFSTAGLLMSVPFVLAMGVVVVSSTAREAWAQATSSVFSAEDVPKKPGTVKKLPKPRLGPSTSSVPISSGNSSSEPSSSAPSSGPAPSPKQLGGVYGRRVR